MSNLTFTYSFKNAGGPFTDSVSIPTGLFINNKFVPASEGSLIDIYNPSTGVKIGEIAGATAKDVDLAVAAAQSAFETSWGRNTPGTERGKLMIKLANLIDQHADELAAIETLNAGLTLFFSRWVNVRICAEIMRYYAGFADKIHGKTIEVNESKLAYTRPQPIGVVGAIIPWNVPLVMASLKLAPALATGNTVILKPSEVTPLTALRLAELAVEAGFPPGVINIIPGYGNTAGAAMASHMGIGKIAFTGSGLVGRRIMKAAAESNIKKVTLELGGKSPSVVLPDADVVQAAKWAAFGIMVNMGQTCTAGSRVYVHADIYDSFMDEFMKTVKSMNVGDPFGAMTFHGPQVSKTHYERILAFIEAGKNEGATLKYGGNRWGSEGYFIEPTVFTNVNSDMTIVKEEIFGPVVVVAKYNTEEELLKLANDSCFGLAAAVFSKDVSKALTIAHKLEAGTVWVNQHSMIEFNVAFGGFKQSGIGREYGEDALKEYLEIKAVHVNLSMPAPI